MDLPKYDTKNIKVRSSLPGDKINTYDPLTFETGDMDDEAWRRFRRMILDENDMDITGVATDTTWAVDDFYRYVAELQRLERMNKWKNRNKK